MKKFIIIFALFSVSIFSACSLSLKEGQNENKANTQIIQFETISYDFGVIKQSGGIVQYDFPFRYNGDTTMSIENVVGSCACTTGETDKQQYKPGEKGVLTVYFNPNLHAEPEGQFFKTVAMITSPKIIPLPEVKVWQEIDLDLGEEFFELSTHDDADNHSEDISYSGEVLKLQSDSQQKTISLEVVEKIGVLADGTEYRYWTYNQTVPGPLLRVQEGDRVTVNLKNNTDNLFSHSIDLHAVNGPGGGGVVSQIAPGEEKSFTFTALNPGVYVYHCATPEVAEHMANGMYGLIVVEPKEGLSPVDKEFYLMQGEIYSVLNRGEKGITQLSGEKLLSETPEYFVFNGSVGSLVGEHALQANVGDTLRLFVGNGGVSKVSSFHVIGEIFDRVYPEGGTPIQQNIQTTVIPAGGASIVEFQVNVPGTYKLVDHALARLQKGLMGELVVLGEENEEVFSYQKPVEVHHIKVEEFIDMQEQKDFILIDVHVPEQEHIKNTDLIISYEEILESKQLPKDKNTKIVVYCRSGSMSNAASNMLVQSGYKNIYNLIGGKSAYDTFLK